MKQENKLPITCYCTNYNGAKWLRRTLKAVDCCEQIIFVDDDSDDDSVEIAKEFTEEIYHWTGKNSMAERRNYSIGFTGDKEYTPEFVNDPEIMDNLPEVRHEWILQLDSDELFGDNLREALINFLKNDGSKVNTVAFDLFNMLQDERSDMGAIPLPRMFRKGTIHWEKDMQNNVEFSTPVGSIETHIQHFGYGDPVYQWLKQWDRLEILETDVRENPDDFERRKYLMNILSVLCGSSPITFERLCAHVTIAVDQFIHSKTLKKSYGSKIAMQKILRFLFGACTRIGDMSPFLVLSHVKEDKKNGKRLWDYVDFLPDPWYWMFIIFRSMPDYEKILEYGEGFFECMHKFQMTKQMVEVTTYGKRYEVAETLQATYQGLADQMGDMDKKKKIYERKGAVWAKKKLEYLNSKQIEEMFSATNERDNR